MNKNLKTLTLNVTFGPSESQSEAAFVFVKISIHEIKHISNTFRRWRKCLEVGRSAVLEDETAETTSASKDLCKCRKMFSN